MPGALGLLPDAMIRTPNRNNKIKDNRRLIIPVPRFLPATRAKTSRAKTSRAKTSRAKTSRAETSCGGFPATVTWRRSPRRAWARGQGRRRARDQGVRRGDTDRLRSPTPTLSPYRRGSETLALAACRPGLSTQTQTS
jgi:hypothetical protein